MRSNVCCLNCGIYGHTTKVCNHPVTSYGLVCYYNTGNDDIKYIMIQKKDTISYTEFIRGKYEINNLNYLLKLFSTMTRGEKEGIRKSTFDELWNNLWNHNVRENKFQKEFNKSFNKFDKLSRGYYMKRIDGTFQLVNIHYLIDNSDCFLEQEWEFPKGRRKLHESDINCSIREFEEETGICNSNKLIIRDNQKQFEEIFQGSNQVRYRNIYYIAEYTGDVHKIKFNQDNLQQAKEVRNVKLFKADDVINCIKHNSEKRELFKRINTIIKKNYLINN